MPIARRRLEPLGVRVFDTTESGDEPLPFADGGFDLAGYDEALRALHAVIESGTPLKVTSYRFLITARST